MNTRLAARLLPFVGIALALEQTAGGLVVLIVPDLLDPVRVQVAEVLLLVG